MFKSVRVERDRGASASAGVIIAVSSGCALDLRALRGLAAPEKDVSEFIQVDFVFFGVGESLGEEGFGEKALGVLGFESGGSDVERVH
eukprot:2959329-Rhodomonas_salina.2